MTGSAFLLLALTAVVAVADWLAASANRRGAEYVLKPLTMIGLIAVALTLDPADDVARWLVVIALVFSLAGDTFLMLPGDLFVQGLGSFFVAHVVYVAALVALGVSVEGLLVGLLIVALAGVFFGNRVIRGAAAADRALAVPVTAYMVVISFMVMTAFATGLFFAIAGALLFFVSDAVLGWSRFVKELPKGHTVVMVTYHLGQAGLVLALI
jgi:uncharacterized membrane protein YhhN